MTDTSHAATELIPFNVSHIPTFTAWFNGLPNNNVWTEAFVRSRTLDDPTYDPGLMLTAIRDGAPVGFILGSLANGSGWIRAFVVHPDLHRHGIGTGLFDAVETAFRDRDVTDITVGWAVPRYFLPGIDVTYTDAIVFLDRHGYQTDRTARVNMGVDLVGHDFDTTEQEAHLADLGLLIRRAAPEDAAQIAELCHTNNNAGWAAETAMALDMSPVPLHVALKDDKICAFAAHSICGPVHFGPMLTAASLRGLGIGSVLLKRCLQDCRLSGLARCEISWTGPLSFYARTVGASMGRTFWAFQKSL